MFISIQGNFHVCVSLATSVLIGSGQIIENCKLCLLKPICVMVNFKHGEIYYIVQW